MYWMIENDEQFSLLLNSSYRKAFIEPIYKLPNVSPRENIIIALYVRPLESSKGFMVNISHNEALPLDAERVEEIVYKFDEVYVRDKKSFLKDYPSNFVKDVNIPPLEYEVPLTQTHTIFYGREMDNSVVPIVKHYELCEQIYHDLSPFFSNDELYSKFFNNRTSPIFSFLEFHPLPIDKKVLKKFYDKDIDKLYNNFNIKNPLTRPTNTTNGINLSALSKESGVRAMIVPHNDILIEIDISAYHPNLLAQKIGYKFPTADIHSHFAELYGVDKKRAKTLTFQQLYGGVFEEYKELEFFKMVWRFTQDLYIQYMEDGYVEVPISGYRIQKEKFGDMGAQKLLNYYLQAYETSHHIKILNEVIVKLIGKKTRILLYTYDAILLDYKHYEGDLLDKIIKVYNKAGVEVGIKKGNNYNNLK